MTNKLQSTASLLRSRASELDKIGDAIESVRFCRNVQRTTEKDEAENVRRLSQLIESVDRLLAL